MMLKICKNLRIASIDLKLIGPEKKYNEMIKQWGVAGWSKIMVSGEKNSASEKKSPLT